MVFILKYSLLSSQLLLQMLRMKYLCLIWLQGYVELSEQEILDRFVLVQQRKQAKQVAKQERAQRRAEKKRRSEDMARKMAEARLQKKMEQQGRSLSFHSAAL